MAHLPKGQGVFLPPFKAWLANNIPAVYDNTLSYYEELCALIKYLQDIVVPAVNENASAVTTISEAVEQLQKYVDDYFKNLDVQEEINNKLDEMAESGQLLDILTAYLSVAPLLCFNTLSDAQYSTNLIEGSTFRTLGKETLNDGYGAYYKVVSTSTDISLSNNLYAELVDDFGSNNYINEISVRQERIEHTDCYIATIPLNDSDGNLINLSVNEDENTTPLTYAENNFTTLTTNSGLTRLDSNNQWKQGAIISNGVILHEDECDVAPTYQRYIGFKADRSVIDFPASSTTTSAMLAQGVKNAFMCFYQMIDNGVIDIPTHPDNDIPFPRNDIGVKLDGTIVILATDGRTEVNTGLTDAQAAQILYDEGCINAWRCDGGGSTSMIYKGSKQNRNIDDSSTTDRNIYVTLNFKKETIDKELAKTFSFIGKERQLLNKQIRDDCDKLYVHSTYDNKLWLGNYSGNYNLTTGYANNVQLQFQDALRHGDKLTATKNANNKYFSFQCSIQTMLHIHVTACFYTKTGSGIRSIQIHYGDTPTLYGNEQMAQRTLSPSANGDVEEITLDTVVNVNASRVNKPFYIIGKGGNGEDFSRLNCYIETIGTAVS